MQRLDVICVVNVVNHIKMYIIPLNRILDVKKTKPIFYNAVVWLNEILDVHQ